MPRDYRALFILLGVGVILIAAGAWIALNTWLFFTGVFLIVLGGAALGAVTALADRIDDA